uniref:Uncharacterized protein n=1 Tax=Oryza punctata TaxID=4537 RepID=A0A0E0M1T3_ORYPU
MVALGSIECLKKRCRQLRVLIHIANLDSKFINNLKKHITGWNLDKEIQGVTKAFKLARRKNNCSKK